MTTPTEPTAFHPTWPEGLEQLKHYEVPCDDKGRNGGSWLRVFVAGDGDVHVSMQDWETVPEGNPTPFPSIRIRSMAGGGRNMRTRQALLWLADAIRRDAIGEQDFEFLEEEESLEALEAALDDEEAAHSETLQMLKTMRTAVEQAFAALVGAHASDDSVQGRARDALKPFIRKNP